MIPLAGPDVVFLDLFVVRFFHPEVILMPLKVSPAWRSGSVWKRSLKDGWCLKGLTEDLWLFSRHRLPRPVL